MILTLRILEREIKRKREIGGYGFREREVEGLSAERERERD